MEDSKRVCSQCHGYKELRDRPYCGGFERCYWCEGTGFEPTDEDKNKRWMKNLSRALKEDEEKYRTKSTFTVFSPQYRQVAKRIADHLRELQEEIEWNL